MGLGIWVCRDEDASNTQQKASPHQQPQNPAQKTRSQQSKQPTKPKWGGGQQRKVNCLEIFGMWCWSHKSQKGRMYPMSPWSYSFRKCLGVLLALLLNIVLGRRRVNVPQRWVHGVLLADQPAARLLNSDPIGVARPSRISEPDPTQVRSSHFGEVASTVDINSKKRDGYANIAPNK